MPRQQKLRRAIISCTFCVMMGYGIFYGIVPGFGLVSAESLKPGASIKIIALGDMPYGKPKKVYPPYEALIGAINKRNPEIVIHVGDTKGGGNCTNEILDQQLAFMNTFNAPVLYTPGDNEWTDCYKSSRGQDEPLERLNYIRKTYFSHPNRSLGKSTIDVEHQGGAGYPENVRLLYKDIMIMTAHIVGSNNNFNVRKISAMQEFFARNISTIAWLKESFTKAANVKIIVIAIHADMFKSRFNKHGRERWLPHSGFAQFGTALQAVAQAFSKPVLLIFGDSHVHKVFQPFPKFTPNVTAVEVYGHHDMHAVEIKIDTSSTKPFTFKPVWNPNLK